MALPQLVQYVTGALKGLFPLQSSAGAADAGGVVALNSAGMVDDSMLATLIGEVQTGIANSAAEIYCGNAFTESTPQDRIIDGGNASTVYGPFDVINGGYA